MNPYSLRAFQGNKDPQLKIKKIVATILYRFVHEHSAIDMVDCFNVGGSTILKYVNIVCDVFNDRFSFW